MMNKKIFIINGSGGVGKDAFVKLVSEELDGKVINFSSIDIIKEIAKSCGWEGGKSERERKFLSDLKLLVDDFSDLTFKNMKEAVEEFQVDNEHAIMFIHIREPKNIQRAEQAFNANSILVERPGLARITSNRSDNSVYDYKYYDVTILNDGYLHDLRIKAIKFIDEFINSSR